MTRTPSWTSKAICAVVGRVLAVSVLLAASAGAAASEAPPAMADPGFCGVKFDQQLVGNQIVYVVYNKCDRPGSFRVWLPGVGRYAYTGGGRGVESGCVVVSPRDHGYFTDVWPDRNWLVHNC